MPSRNHAIVQMNLGNQFLKDERYRTCSELTLTLGGRDYTPDLSIFPRVPVDWDHDDSKVTDAPLLVVEILSPQQGMQPVMDKLDVYFAHGVKSCWIVTPHLKLISAITPDRARRNFDSGIVTDAAIGIAADVAAVFS